MRVLVVEDYAPVRKSVSQGLREAGFAVDATGDGEEGLWYAQSNDYDVIVLDLMLPALDGLTLLRRLREDGHNTHVLILTAKDQLEDRVQGLNLGADDYLVKPFALEELLARLRALLRRAEQGHEGGTLQYADLAVDPAARTVRRGDRAIDLTKTEFDLLELLVMNAGIVLSRDTIYERIWGFDFETSSNSLDVYVGYLRRKTEAEGEARLVHTVRGVGYVAREQ